MIENNSGPKWDAAAIIRQAKALSAKKSTLAAQGAAAQLADFPKTLSLLEAARRLPGLALTEALDADGLVSYRLIAEITGLDLISLRRLIDGRVELIAGPNSVAFIEDGAAEIALVGALPEILGEIVDPDHPAIDAARGGRIAQILKEIRRRRKTAAATARLAAERARQLEELAAPAIGALRILDRRGFRLPNGRRLVVRVESTALLRLVSLDPAGRDDSQEVIAEAAFDGISLNGTGAFGNAWRAHALDHRSAALIDFEAPGRMAVDRAAPALDKLVPIVIAEAALEAGLVAPHPNDPTLLTRIDLLIRPILARAQERTRLRHANIALGLERHEIFNTLMAPLIADCVALAEAGLCDQDAKPFLFDLADDLVASAGATLAAYLDPVDMPKLQISLGRFSIAITMSSKGDLLVGRGDEIGLAPKEYESSANAAGDIHRLAMLQIAGREPVIDSDLALRVASADKNDIQLLDALMQQAAQSGSWPAAARDKGEDKGEGGMSQKPVGKAARRLAARGLIDAKLNLTREGRLIRALARARGLSKRKRQMPKNPLRAQDGG